VPGMHRPEADTVVSAEIARSKYRGLARERPSHGAVSVRIISSVPISSRLMIR
jgi:hypothetical protein